MFGCVAACGLVAIVVGLAYVYGWMGVGMFAALVAAAAGSGFVAWRRQRS